MDRRGHAAVHAHDPTKGAVSGLEDRVTPTLSFQRTWPEQVRGFSNGGSPIFRSVSKLRIGRAERPLKPSSCLRLLVGAVGIEPTTSPVGRERFPAELSARP